MRRFGGEVGQSRRRYCHAALTGGDRSGLRPWIPAAVVGACLLAAAVAGYPLILIVVLALLMLLWVSNALQLTGHGNVFVFAAKAVRRLRRGGSAS